MAEVPTAAISRLVTYLRILEQLETREVSRTSSTDLAERAGVSAFQVRRTWPTSGASARAAWATPSRFSSGNWCGCWG